MLGAYLTLAEAGLVLGVGPSTVRDMIVNGPLIGITREMGLMVHEEDLKSFRRPLGIASSSNNLPPAGSELYQSANPAHGLGVLAQPIDNTLIIRPCGEARGTDGRGVAARHLRLVRT